ncbi:MAG: hypothetical protein R3C62_12545 [Chloroflexota bacterium]
MTLSPHRLAHAPPDFKHGVGAGWRGLTQGEQTALSPRRLAHASPANVMSGLNKGETTGRRGQRRCQR